MVQYKMTDNKLAFNSTVAIVPAVPQPRSFARRESYVCVRFKVFTAVTMKNGVFWDVTLCGSCTNRRFEELSASFISVTRICEPETTQVLTSNRRTA
jgi:hypothetical protein